MTPTPSTQPLKPLSDLSPYIYGTTRLGDQNIPFAARVRLARMAMNAGVWFHTSHTYGNALEVLRVAFDQDRTHVPQLIVKIIAGTEEALYDVIRENIEPLGIDSIAVGQLCLGDGLADEFASGGPCYKTLEKIRAEGLVKRYVVEVFPWTSWMSLNALRGGYTTGVVDGFIFYLNPIQRFASNELWDLIVSRDESVVAMRTVSGGNIHRLRDVPGAAWKPYIQQRAVEVAPIYERSGISSWTEFCVRFAHSFPQVRATVGSSGRTENLQEFLLAAKNIQPLPQDIVNEISALQHRWSDETDMRAELWSM